MAIGPQMEVPNYPVSQLNPAFNFSYQSELPHVPFNLPRTRFFRGGGRYSHKQNTSHQRYPSGSGKGQGGSGGGQGVLGLNPRSYVAKHSYYDQNSISLQKLQKDNRRKTKKHFKGSYGQLPRFTPRSVPPAPANTNSFLLSTTGSSLVSPLGQSSFHAVTPNPFLPGTAWKNSYGTVDKEAAELGAAAGINLFGTNAGLIIKSGTEFDDLELSEEDAEDTRGFELHIDDEELERDLPPAAQARMEEQAAYIAELEEQNLNLQEKLYLMEQELEELRKKNSHSPETADNQELEDIMEGQGISTSEGEEVPGVAKGAVVHTKEDL